MGLEHYQSALPTILKHGQKTVATAGTEEALVASSVSLVAGLVEIKALPANTGVMYVGLNPVTSATGFPLSAGESVVLHINDLQTIYIDSTVNGEGVAYIAT